MIRQKKVSELPEATSIEGLVSLGVDASNKSVKIPINLLKGNQGMQGPKGDRGDSGVYVGSTPPTDGSVKIAIDPTGDVYNGIPFGGKAGEMLVKSSAADFDTKWSSPLRPLFVARGAIYNETTGYYELNGLTDITETQMANVYNKTSPVFCTLSQLSSNFLFLDSAIVTNFLPVHGNGFTPWDAGVYAPTSSRAMFRGCRQLKVANLGEMFVSNNITYLFLGDIVLRKILGVLDVSNISNATYTTLAFSQCYLLEEVKIKGLKVSLSLADCAKLTKDSILYLVTNAANTAAVTLTLHADAKARLTAEDIALASSKNITLTT